MTHSYQTAALRMVALQRGPLHFQAMFVYWSTRSLGKVALIQNIRKT